MTKGILAQGQPLTAIGLPDYVAEGAAPWIAGQHGCRAITVSQLRGPMGWYDVAVIEFDTDTTPQIHPLHLCDFIST